jgi:hypothetical protein
MTPDTIRQATRSLAQDAGNWRQARSSGAAFGRALASQIKARAIATEQLNQAAAIEIELCLLQLAASADELEAEIAGSALRELHKNPLLRPEN